MSFFTPTAKVNPNHQESLEYAIYMIVGSHFKKARCQNNLAETRMRLNYLEESEKEQIRLENFCISQVKPIFYPLPRWIRLCEVETQLLRREDGFTEIRFVGEKFILRLLGRYSKNKPEIISEYWEC